MFSEEIIKRLEKDLDKKLVLQRWDGFDYIPGFVAIQHANAIFGYDSWGYEIVSTKRDGMFIHSIVRVWVFDGDKKIERCDIGTGKIEMTREKKDKQGNIIKPSEEMQEMAYKGSVTDGLKRALRTFGKQFGLGLYDEQDQLQYITRELTEKERDIIKPFINKLQICNSITDLEKINKELSKEKDKWNKRMLLYVVEVYKQTEKDLIIQEKEKELKEKLK